MLAIHDKDKRVIFSKGKTGTTTLQNALEGIEGWDKVMGEGDTTWYGIGPEEFGRKARQEEVVATLSALDYDILFIIRKPWARYVSGWKEILQDYISALIPEDEFIEFWNKLINDPEQLIKYIDRLFYLTQFVCSEEQTVEHSWGRAFTLHTNYHTCNWLYMCNQFPNATIIKTENLTSFMRGLGIGSVNKSNVSRQSDIDALETALKECKHYYLIEKFLLPEQKRYDNICQRL